MKMMIQRNLNACENYCHCPRVYWLDIAKICIKSLVIFLAPKDDTYSCRFRSKYESSSRDFGSGCVSIHSLRP